MTPQNLFEQAASGEVATDGFVSEIVIGGREASTESAMTMAELIGKAAEDGVANTVNMFARVDFDSVTKVEPPQGLSRHPDAQYDQEYKYNAHDMFGTEGPSGP